MGSRLERHEARMARVMAEKEEEGERVARARSCESPEEDKETEGTGLRRTTSLRRRDGSWDSRWGNQLSQASPRQSRSAWTRPGKLNNSYWEERVRGETRLAPRTPPPRRRLRGVLDDRLTPVDTDSGCHTSPVDLELLPPPSEEELCALAASHQEQKLQQLSEDEAIRVARESQREVRAALEAQAQAEARAAEVEAQEEALAEYDRIVGEQEAAAEAARAGMERLLAEQAVAEGLARAHMERMVAENEAVEEKRAAEAAKEAARKAEVEADALQEASKQTKLAKEAASNAEKGEKAALEAEAVMKLAKEAEAAQRAATEAEAAKKAAREAEIAEKVAKKAAKEAEAAEKAAKESEAKEKAAKEAEAKERVAREKSQLEKAARETELAELIELERAAEAEAAKKAFALAEQANIEAAEKDARVASAKKAAREANEAEASKKAAKVAAEAEGAKKVADIAMKAKREAESAEKAAREAEAVVKAAKEAETAEIAARVTALAVMELELEKVRREEEEARMEYERQLAIEEVAQFEVAREESEKQAALEAANLAEVVTAKVEAGRFKIEEIKNPEAVRVERERFVAQEKVEKEAARIERGRQTLQAREEKAAREAAAKLEGKATRDEVTRAAVREAVVARIVAEASTIVAEAASSRTASREGGVERVAGSPTGRTRAGEEEATARDLEQEVSRLGMLSPPAPQEDNTALLAASHSLSQAFSSALNTLTEETPREASPLPPPPPLSSSPLPPPPILPSSISDRKRSLDLPSPPPCLEEPPRPATPQGPPRPAPPAALLAQEHKKLTTLERRVETQYKKYPKSEQRGSSTPPRPSPPRGAPPPPRRSSSKEQVKSCPTTPRSTKRQVLIRAVRTPSPTNPNAVKYVAADSPPPTESDRVPSGMQQADRVPSGMYSALPVCVADSPLPREDPPPPLAEGRRAFVDSMLKAEKVSQAVTAQMDVVRQHRVKNLQDINETDRKAERAIASELEKRQKEVEDILRKKKDEEHLKRLEFEEQRIKEENDKMKKEAEEKRKREQEDVRLQELLRAQECSNISPAPAKVPEKKHVAKLETEEELYRREEEMMIKMGREEHFKEFAKKHQIAEVKPVETATAVIATPTPKPSPKPIRQAAISEYIRPSPTAGRKQYSGEKTRTLAVVEDQDKTFNSFSVFEANKQMQKPKYQTFTDQEKGQTSSAPSSSRRWQNVNTGLVKNRSNVYLIQDPTSSLEPSPRVPRKTFPASPPAEVPWRRQEVREGPAVALLGVQVEKGQKEKSPAPAPPAVREKSPAVRGQSPALGNAVAGLSVTMAELETLGARQEGREDEARMVTGAVAASAVVSQAAASVRDVAKGVREVARCLLSTITPEREQCDEWCPGPGEESEGEDDFGYEEEHSVGIDLPQGADPTSGNVTPTPTTGELEELSISSGVSHEEPTVVEELRSNQGSRATPLKSLLKKPSMDREDVTSSDSESDDGKVSPKKVHFSEIDQIKLMSQESLASLLSSEADLGGSSSLVTSLPAHQMRPTFVLASPATASITSLMANRQKELERALQQ